jgi:hypothetical protein
MSNRRLTGMVLGSMGGAVLAIACPANAQDIGGPPAGADMTGGARVQDIAAANRQVDSDYNTLAARGVEVVNRSRDDVPRRAKPSVALASAEDLSVGASLRDVSGAPIATIERLEADGVVVRSEDRLAKLPLEAFGKDSAGLMLGITAAEFRAAIADTSVVVPEQEAHVAATAADIMLGAAIRDSEDVPIGTVDSLSEDGVVILTDGKKVKLPVNSFGKDKQGLIIGITASEFKAIIGRSASTGG